MTGQLRERLDMRESETESSGLNRADSQARAPGMAMPPGRPRRRQPAPPGRALARTVEAEIIPRLVFALRETRPPEALAGATGAADSPEIEAFIKVVLAGDIAEACSSVDAMRARGLSLEQIYLGLLEPAARRLGELWNEDVYDFVAVTVSILKLQQVLHEFGLAFRGEAEFHEHGQRALLVPAPGEKASFGHLVFGTFGLVLAAEFLRRDGWDAYVDCSASSADTIGIVRREWFDVIEMSLTHVAHLGELTAGIQQIRRASRNRTIGVIVSGRVFRDHPEKATCVGADMVAVDARQAATQADNLMELLRRR